MDNLRLYFGQGNAKLSSQISIFSLPAGHSCPNARECLSKTDEVTGKLTDGPKVLHRCYAASMECRRTSVRVSRWRNFRLLKEAKTEDRMSSLILKSLSPFAGYVRVHDSGDFFNRSYLRAWLRVAEARPRTTLYFYTKALSLWLEEMDRIGNGWMAGSLLNVVPTASWGGTHDHLIEGHGLRSARVVYSEQEAEQRGLLIDHDDSLAAARGGDFALLIHGAQPAGSDAGRAMSALRKSGWYGYGSGKRLALATA